MSSTATVRTRGGAAPARPRHQPAPAPARRRHLRTVPEAPTRPGTATRRRVKPHVALTIAIMTFFLILFGVALLQTVLVQGQIHLDGLRADVADRQTEAQVLRHQVDELESPEHLIGAAESMGMVQLDPTFVSSPPEADPTAP